ncbi:MAG: hypothetical protein JWM93_685, partial [Frankiales bacterium]|nr:hypothetical protein [Frankiales bacterium]
MLLIGAMLVAPGGATGTPIAQDVGGSAPVGTDAEQIIV